MKNEDFFLTWLKTNPSPAIRRRFAAIFEQLVHTFLDSTTNEHLRQTSSWDVEREAARLEHKGARRRRDLLGQL